MVLGSGPCPGHTGGRGHKLLETEMEQLHDTPSPSPAAHPASHHYRPSTVPSLAGRGGHCKRLILFRAHHGDSETTRKQWVPCGDAILPPKFMPEFIQINGSFLFTRFMQLLSTEAWADSSELRKSVYYYEVLSLYYYVLLQGFIIALLCVTCRHFISAADLHPYDTKHCYIVHLRSGTLAVAWQSFIATSVREAQIWAQHGKCALQKMEDHHTEIQLYVVRLEQSIHFCLEWSHIITLMILVDHGNARK